MDEHSEPDNDCGECGRALPPDAPGGLCPYCLLMPADTRSAAAFEPPEPGELQEHFEGIEVISLLGRGGMGAVYLARQRHLDREVALKILPPEAAGRAGFESRFTREARTLAKLTHPGIVAVYDFGRAGPFHYLVMQYVEGVNLRELMAGEKLSPAAAMRIVPELCEALQYAHDRGVVHRDVKPENVLLSEEGHVLVADFGLARVLSPGQTRLTGTRQAVGTPHYMAPEQVERPGEVDHRADIYALGVVFYEMLTGGLPLGRFDPPSAFGGPPAVDRVVLKTLEKEPDRRYDSAAGVKSDLENPTAVPPSAETVRQTAERWAAAGASAVGDYAADVRTEVARRDRLAVVGLYAAATYAVAVGGVLVGLNSRFADLGTTFSGLGVSAAVVGSLLTFRQSAHAAASPAFASPAVGFGRRVAGILQEPAGGPRRLTGLAGVLGEPRPPLGVLVGAAAVASASAIAGGGLVAMAQLPGHSNPPFVLGLFGAAATWYLAWAWRDRIGRRLGLGGPGAVMPGPAPSTSQRPAPWSSALSGQTADRVISGGAEAARAAGSFAARWFWPAVATVLLAVLGYAGLFAVFVLYPLPTGETAPGALGELSKLSTSPVELAAVAAAAVVGIVAAIILALYALMRATSGERPGDRRSGVAAIGGDAFPASGNRKQLNGFAVAAAVIPAAALVNPVLGSALLNFEPPVRAPDPGFLAIMGVVSLGSAAMAGRAVRRGRREGAWLAVVGPLLIPVAAAFALAFEWGAGLPEGDRFYPWAAWAAVRVTLIAAATAVSAWGLRWAVFGPTQTPFGYKPRR